MEEKWMQVRLSKALAQFLRQQGYTGESYDQTIRRLIENCYKLKVPDPEEVIANNEEIPT